MPPAGDGALRTSLSAVLRDPMLASRDAGLRQHVCAFVDQAKAKGWPPERVLVEVKTIAREVGFEVRSAMGNADSPETRDEVLTKVVGWCIEHYYA